MGSPKAGLKNGGGVADREAGNWRDKGEESQVVPWDKTGNRTGEYPRIKLSARADSDPWEQSEARKKHGSDQAGSPLSSD